MDQVQPNNRTDAATLMHDVDYMIANNNNQALIADLKAIKRADQDLPGFVTKWGLALRSLLLPSKFYGGDSALGLKLKNYIKNNKEYQKTFKNLNMDQELLNW